MTPVTSRLFLGRSPGIRVSFLQMSLVPCWREMTCIGNASPCTSCIRAAVMRPCGGYLCGCVWNGEWEGGVCAVARSLTVDTALLLQLLALFSKRALLLSGSSRHLHTIKYSLMRVCMHVCVCVCLFKWMLMVAGVNSKRVRLERASQRLHLKMLRRRACFTNFVRTAIHFLPASPPKLPWYLPWSECVCVNIYMCMYIYMHSYICIYVYVCIYVYICK